MFLFAVHFKSSLCHCMLQLSRSRLLLNACLLVLFIAFAIMQGGKEVSILCQFTGHGILWPLSYNQYPLTAEELSAVKSLSVHLAFRLSLALKMGISSVSSACICLSLFLRFSPQPSFTSVVTCVCVIFFFSSCCLSLPRSVLLLCACSRGHSISSADIVHCFFPGGGC